ncbi:zinc ribbon domain-containing protein [Kitasatospora sp. NPDC049285]|uniref:zinc ribbon domain-containing protein n=1 Tax=Kitasatospora sp. NPDC049285 TaxID=3157096 RepID=UPI00341E3C70
MIVCRECGNAAPSRDDFCGSCGALLAWAGEAVETPAERSGAAGGAGRIARQPDAEAVRPTPEPIAEEPEYTGPYCWSCGVVNPDGRTFCRACGQPLRGHPGEAGPRAAWWRRVFARHGRRAAGERPGGFRRHETSGPAAPGTGGRRWFRRPTMTTVRRLTPLLVLASLAGLSLSPARHWAIDQVTRLTGTAKSELTRHYVPDTPSGATGSAADPGHGGALAVDGIGDSYWSVGTPKDGVGAVLTVTFPAPVDLDQLGLLSGVPAPGFRGQPRLHRLWIAAEGHPAVELTFDDAADFQTRGLNLHGVTTVTVTVEDVYPGQQGHALAVRELQFFTLKRGAQ